MAKHKKALREGFTTGTAATAAAMAALQCLLHEGEKATHMLTPLPPEAFSAQTRSECAHQKHGKAPMLSIAVGGVQRHHACSATAFVIKDGGDDPDVTHKAHIYATVTIKNRPHAQDIHIEGGEGVGRVTLPGLPVPVGMAAINPAPRAQISLGLQSIAQKYAYTQSIDVTISVPGGEALAQKTFNPRLGIHGGISILGTQGTVKPYSHTAWKATILQGVHVAMATDCRTLCLSTGRRSEKLLLQAYPHVLPQGAVQAADFAAFSLSEAGKHDFEHIVWGCFFGKLVKLAQGHAYTHARTAHLDFPLLYRWCAQEGVDIPEILACVTANHALEYILARETWPQLLHSLTERAAKVASQFAQRPVTVRLFHLDGRTLACVA